MNRGLEYLYEHCHPAMKHRDMKSSNIVLEENFNAKVLDFGLAITGGSQSKKNIKLLGTMGYVALEYLLDVNTLRDDEMEKKRMRQSEREWRRLRDDEMEKVMRQSEREWCLFIDDEMEKKKLKQTQ
ncbi:hypothetical protein VNO78_12298 [Psophocarpus tetragonolobus]|uniref:Protein kinase domain-containing protein n=1 Tax=Psophocarpus tetragonolobus TaxID=3891 RepID=A0AAN9XPB2_PSOTE